MRSPYPCLYILASLIACHAEGTAPDGGEPGDGGIGDGDGGQRCVVKAATSLDLPAWLRGWLGAVRLPGAVQLQVDVDPISFL